MEPKSGDDKSFGEINSVLRRIQGNPRYPLDGYVPLQGEGHYCELPFPGEFSEDDAQPDQSELERLAQQLRDHGTSLIYQQDDRQIDVTSLLTNTLSGSSGAQPESEYSQGEGEYRESPLIGNYGAYREQETFQREVQGTWSAPTDDQVDAMSLAMDTLSRYGRSHIQTLPSNWNANTTFTRLSGYLGSFVENLLEVRPDHARKCEEDGRLWDLVAAFRDFYNERWRLGIIADCLEDNGFPTDDIRLVIMRKKPELWQMSWWPTCLRRDGDK